MAWQQKVGEVNRSSTAKQEEIPRDVFSSSLFLICDITQNESSLPNIAAAALSRDWDCQGGWWWKENDEDKWELSQTLEVTSLINTVPDLISPAWVLNSSSR